LINNIIFLTCLIISLLSAVLAFKPDIECFANDLVDERFNDTNYPENPQQESYKAFDVNGTCSEAN
jgi:hypothetical protein